MLKVLIRFRYILILSLLVLSIKLNPLKEGSNFVPSRPISKNVVTFDGFFLFSNLAGILFSIMLTSVFGSIVANILFRNSRFKFTILETYWFGYIIILAPFRIITYVFSIELSRIIIFTLIVIFCILFRTNLSLSKSRILDPKNLIKVVLIVVISCVLFILQVKQGDFSWVGHGTDQYQWFTKELINFQYPNRIPVFNQHSDDWLITILYVFPNNIQYDPIILLSIILIVIKLSSYAFYFRIFKNFNNSNFESFLMSLFLCLGTWNLVPKFYNQYFDSSNPIFFVVHPGRIVGINLAILLIILFIFNDKVNQIDLLQKIAIFLFSFGISQTSVSNSFNIAFIIFVLSYLRYNFKSKIYFNSKNNIIMLSLLILSSFAFTNSNVKIGDIPPGITFLPIIIYFLFYFFHYVIQDFKLLRFNIYSNFKFFIYYVVTSLISMIFMGNIFVENVLNQNLIKFFYLIGNYQPSLNKISPTDFGPPCCGGSAISVINGVEYLELSNVFTPNESKHGLFFVDVREIGEYVQYTKSPLYFLYSFLIFALLLFLITFLLKNKRYFLKNLIFFYTVILLWLLLNIFHQNFINDASRSWTKSRFLEIPIYLLIFLFLLVVTMYRRKRILLSILALWVIVPFWNLDILSFLNNNLNFLINLYTYHLVNKIY